MNCSVLFNEINQLILENLPALQASRYKVKYKADGSPVTEADVWLEKLIGSHLGKRLPGLRLIGEESFDFTWEASEGYLAILDPIDGTENFCSGLKEWGVSLSLWQGRTHLGSMLMMPELGESLKTGIINILPKCVWPCHRLKDTPHSLSPEQKFSVPSIGSSMAR